MKLRVHLTKSTPLGGRRPVLGAGHAADVETSLLAVRSRTIAAMVASRARRSPGESSSPLLELDSELGCLLSPERAAAAAREIRVRVTSIQTGEWHGGRLVDADPAHYGLLVLDGVMAREVVLHAMVSTELLGPGDVVRPWRIEGSPQLLPVSVRWNALDVDGNVLRDTKTTYHLLAAPDTAEGWRFLSYTNHF